jgi:hypothetical protein
MYGVRLEVPDRGGTPKDFEVEVGSILGKHVTRVVDGQQEGVG